MGRDRQDMMELEDMERFALEEPWRAIRESERCLGCYDAPCAGACPTHIQVPRFIGRIRTGNLAGAYETLVSANALPAICGLVCPTEYLCEGACVVAQLGAPPVQIGALQYFACKAAQTAESFTTTRSERVAVIGGGPAGIACAVELRRLGYAVDLYDQHERLGGLIRYAIPSYRLPDAAVEAELGRLTSEPPAGSEPAGGLGALHLGVRLDRARLAEILAEYDAVFLGMGLSAAQAPAIAGLQLAGVWPALSYLDAVRRAGRGEGSRPALGQRVVVIGGGNVAVDAASVAAAQGAGEVIVLYRRTVDEMPAWEEEYKDAVTLGVQFRWLTGVSEIVGQDGRVTGVRVQQMRLTEPDASGRRGAEPVAGGEESLACDAVLVAIGQALECDDLQALGIEVTPEGTVSVDPETGQVTSRRLGTCGRLPDGRLPAVFAGGDAARGGSFVVQAIADGARAARAIHRHLAQEAGR